MTTALRNWSTTAASNNSTPPNGAPEGATYVNQLTDILRQIMAEVRSWYENSGWIDYGHTPTYSSATAFTLSGDRTSTYQVGRRVRAINSTLTTIYGTITASVFSTSTTTVTVSWDSGTLDNTLAEVAVGAAPVSNSWLSFSSLTGALSRSQLPAESIFQTGMTQPYFGTTAPTGWVLWFGTLGNGASGASNRANADTQALYERIWTICTNTEAPVTGGRGGSATSDFNAGKPIAFPDPRGCVVAVLDNLGGSAANRITSGVSGINGNTIGARGGNEAMQSHTHGVTDPGHAHSVGVTPISGFSAAGGANQFVNTNSNSTSTATTGVTISSSGAGSSQNVQPTIMMPYIVKL